MQLKTEPVREMQPSRATALSTAAETATLGDLGFGYAVLFAGLRGTVAAVIRSPTLLVAGLKISGPK